VREPYAPPWRPCARASVSTILARCALPAPRARSLGSLSRVTLLFARSLWKDSVKASDGLECSTSDASGGYLSDDCVRYIDALVMQATEAGLWVIIAARAKYAAGWSGPDVWHSHELRRQVWHA
jgi:hypothetical protein